MIVFDKNISVGVNHMIDGVAHIISLVKEFVSQANNSNDLKYGKYKASIKFNDVDLVTKASFGQGTKAKVPWYSIMKPGQTTSNGYYPVYLLDLEAKILVLAYGISEEFKPLASWDKSITADKIQIKNTKNITNIISKYPNSYVFREYLLDENFKVKSTDKELVNDLEQILVSYVDNVALKINEKDKLIIGKIKEVEILDNKKQIILYGPAGTGKTYNTKSIIEAHSGEIYNDLKANYRVQFVTFHQSFAYEDFIEGIKPNLNEEVEGNISYKVENGIFKELCEKAVISNRRLVDQSHEKITSNSKFWKISLGDSQTNEATMVYDYCIENNCIALGWNEDAKNSMFNRFKNEIKRGDLVFVSNGNRKIKALARVVGDFREEDTEIGYKNYRDVEWLIKDMNLATDKLFKSYFSQMSFYSLDNNKPDLEKLNKILVGNDVIEYSESTIKEHLEKFYKKDKEEKEKYFEESSQNYYLIIDEINRGNISKIFGELITLLESSKRLGEADELTTTLPYSKEEFGIPPNLYIIGTMNTSDKSIAHLDIALRRRFGFVEMLPSYDEKIIKNEKCRILLKNLNDRIEILLDKDHLIGHSFFCGKSEADIPTIMQNEIVPLLEEYFYGDYEKIQLVLGSKNINKEVKKLGDYEKEIYKYWFDSESNLESFDIGLGDVKESITKDD
ncbi:AAA domain family protein [Francisella philomiragia]|uniref:MrcB family domain-containing protein n=2 Tax=Francisella philomiragia TaxID=28110 RepID=UPI0005A57D1A|nr:DUF3578 domain-containing protein [Francisella philomiragia]AJI55216.1 AAA domain family protein [Francisella philomiragia]